MEDLGTAFGLALDLLLAGDPELLEIVRLSLAVSLSAVAIACVVGMPLGALLASLRFPGRQAVIVLLNALMGLPPVVVGLLVYILLSNAGPLGALQLLYTPSAMIIAQAILVTPIAAALSRELLASLQEEYAEQLQSLGIGPWRAIPTLIYEGRFGLLTAALAGFGRAVAEVGAVMIVGGNIRHVTRVMTTAIALETSKGEIALALALGLVLVSLAVLVTGATAVLRGTAARLSHV